MGTRSWWGWGNVEDAVTGAEEDELVGRIAALMPDADLSRHPVPDVRSLPMADSRIAPPAALADLVSDDVTDRAGHAHGKAFRDVVRNLRGDVTDAPDLVVRPESEQDVVDVLDWCGSDNIALIPYGGGSSVVGGIEPRGLDGYSGTVSLDLARLNRVHEIDDVSRAARIGAGILGPDLGAALRPRGLALRHFPQSFEFSTLGGWIATRAGGHYATGPTHIDDFVESMSVVTPAGVARSLRVPGSGAGPSPDRMFLGSEGTLGVITEAWIRLQERPRWRAGASATFDRFADAVAAVRAISQSGLQPANCRLLDPAEAFLNAGTSTSGGVVILGFESAHHPVDGDLEIATAICLDHGGRIPDGTVSSGPDSAASRSDAAESWRGAFLRMPYHRDALARRSMIVETFETSCTWDRFERLHADITEAATNALASLGLNGVLTCRFTHVYPDGPAPYYGVYAAGTWGRTLEQWDTIKAAVSEALHSAGGTITHHHAVGRDHRPWYDRQRPDPFAIALTGAKRALDPRGILNPGVLIDMNGESR